MSCKSEPSSAIEQAMQATLASIELPPPPSSAVPVQPMPDLPAEIKKEPACVVF